MSILTFHNVAQSFGATDIFIGLSAEIPRQARIGLVGPNGIGKTTLLRILAGIHPPTEGGVHVAKGTRIGYLQQEAVRAFEDKDNTVYEEMLTVFAGLRAQAARLRRLEEEMTAESATEELLEQYGAIQEAFELAGGYDYEVRIQQVLSGLGFQSDQQHMPLAHCSGGQKTRALLARLLLERPDLLILDEPTNHLDVAAVEWLEDTLSRWEGAVLIVSHDRYLLDRVTDTIWEMSRGGLETYRGNYTAYLLQREERWARRDVEFEAVRERFLSELDFVKRNIARASTSDQAKGRLRRLVRMVKAVEIGGAGILQQNWLRVTEEIDISKTKWNVAEVESHIKALQSPNPHHSQVRMRLRSAQRGGNMILQTHALRIGYPGTPLFEAEDLELRRREIAALIGPNGTGKTTFLRTLLGEIEPLSGEMRLGANLQIGYFAQAHDTLNRDRSVMDELLSHQEMLPGAARDYLAQYLFCGDDVFKPIQALSGGERGRMALALLSLQRANFLLLDEPTNHLDIPAQETLQEALQHFDGTILLVSHDRYLVDRLATQIWELRDERLHVHKGNYASFLEARALALEKEREAKAAVVATVRRAAPPPPPKPDDTLARTEASIDEIESQLEQINEELLQATQAQRWEEVRTLNAAYAVAHTQLEALIARWEAISVG